MESNTKPPVFVLLGRYGDIIQLLPAFRVIRQRIGMAPVVIVSTDYANVLDGVSYVQAHSISCDWWRGIPAAYRLANELYGGGVCPQWWLLDKESAGVVENPGGIILQSHGLEWGVNVKDWPDYGTSMWDRAGFTREEMRTFPLVFDRRDFGREERLVKQYRRTNKPMFLVNFSGYSSPFAPVPEVMSRISPMLKDCEIVDLGKVTGQRIYDLLGFMDRAIGMITTDTATLHLAPASKVTYLAYTVDGWCSSVPKGHCVKEIKYSQAIDRLSVLEEYITLFKLSSLQPQKRVVKAYGVPLPA